MNELYDSVEATMTIADPQHSSQFAQKKKIVIVPDIDRGRVSVTYVIVCLACVVSG